MSRLRNKTALVTGGSAGIGEAIVRRFAAEGAQVLIGDIDQTGGECLCRELGSAVAFQRLDVSAAAAFERAIQRVMEPWDKLDILVNNAGIVLPAETVQDTTEEEFDRLMNVNLRSVFLGCKLAYPHLRASGGCVLNISSMAGVTGQERHAVYAATKGSINAMIKCIASDWGPEGIRINALCPVGVWTQTLRDWIQVQPDSSKIEDYLKHIHALRYCPEPEEIASVAAFLCSDDAKLVTGCILPVSGGGECGYRYHGPPSHVAS
ncbi:glucose 1-dehydrogenase [Acidobacteria bacterium AH-259-O06]|nr:glucose 1-dehydrogenase [Acidobacteria bacterium AH-259-O06]